MPAELLQQQENKFLSRREVTARFTEIKGNLKRDDAASMIAQQLNVNKANVFPLKIEFEAGRDSAKGTFYIYSDVELAKKYLPKFLMIRSLSKEERKKVREEMRKTKQAATAAVATAEKKK
jgi:ribosomal protein S24E